MAFEVIDLTSDGEAEIESPSKILKQFQADKDRGGRTSASGPSDHCNGSGNPSSSGFTDGDAQNSLFDIRRSYATSLSAAARSRPSVQITPSHHPTSDSGTQQHIVQAAEQDFMNSMLSPSVQAVYGPSGPKLKSELLRIEPNLKRSERQQSELELERERKRRERIEKADRYHERRSSGNQLQKMSKPASNGSATSFKENAISPPALDSFGTAGTKLSGTQQPGSHPAINSGIKRPLSELSGHCPTGPSAKQPRTSQPDKSYQPQHTRPEKPLLSVEPELLTNKRTVTSSEADPNTKRLSYYDEPELPSIAQVLSGTNKFKAPYSADEDALLRKLKEVDMLSWSEIHKHFESRTIASLQVRYSTKVKGTSRPKVVLRTDKRALFGTSNSQDQAGQPRAKRQRKSDIAAVDGFVSWATAKAMSRGEGAAESIDDHHQISEVDSGSLAQRDSVLLRSTERILRQREIGLTSGGRSWAGSKCSIPPDLKKHVFTDYTLQRFYHGTSGDVVGLSWAADSEHFAAGSIAITDNLSMQYNMSRNLLVGDNKHGELHELVDHHVPRPVVHEAGNVNALRSMRYTQDQRLFMTVTATAFSPTPGKQHWLFTTGTDKILRRYSIDKPCSTEKRASIQRTGCRYAIEHSASVDLLAIHPDGFVATGCHSASNSIKVFECGSRTYSCPFTSTPTYSDSETSVAIYPSALKWGEAPAHRQFLLAGFCGDEEKQLAGETALWNIEHEQQIPIRGTTRNVSDVAWNPSPSRASIQFAVASNAYGIDVGKGMRSVVQCFGQTHRGLQRVVAWECPALDINDIVFCPHDDNIIAAGATNGKVYVWDQRWIDRKQTPWHTLSHNESLNVLPHDRDSELTDTGVRFLSWGTTRDRLYSGSSDGTVKIWNPYRAIDNCHIDDIQVPGQHRSAIRSGSFSPDFTKLLVGTENGRINCFEVGGDTAYRSYQFKLHTAPVPDQQDKVVPFEDARSLVQSTKIEIRPYGAMPIIQAVQGSAYDGPFSAPSKDDLTAAEEKLQQALSSQMDLTTRIERDGTDTFGNEDLQKACIQVRNAQADIEDLQNRLDFANDSRKKAQAIQRSLADAEEAREALLMSSRLRFGSHVEHCNLLCGYQANPDGVEDTGRSELRIPDLLRSVSDRGLSPPDEEGKEGGDSSVCSSCFPHHRRVPGKALLLCVKCKLEEMLKSMRLTTKCSKCSAPARVEMEGKKTPLCERCSFSCFRCSKPVDVLENADIVQCKPCALAWESGVLGYELVSETRKHRAHVVQSPQHDEDPESDDFGALERERLASRFEVEL